MLQQEGDLLGNQNEENGEYQRWIKAFDQPSKALVSSLRKEIESQSRRPLISVLMPVADPSPEHLRAAIDSVLGQPYSRLELCIVDDASRDPKVLSLLRATQKSDPRVKLHLRTSRGGIAAATNDALSLATGDYVALVDHDDLLAQGALLLVAKELLEHPETVVLYTDEDKINEEGTRFEPYFKPDWNPALLLGENYISHLCVLQKQVVKQLGGWRSECDGAQDYDMVLRVSRVTSPAQVRHLPWPCYHWRSSRTSTSASIDNKPYVREAAYRALTDHLQAIGTKARVQPAWENSPYQRIIWELPSSPPPITIVIPTRDGRKLRDCVTSLLEKTEYPSMSVVIIDNGSEKPETLELLDSLSADERVVIRRDPRSPFNFSALNNAAIAEIDTPYVLLLNDDTEVTHGDWLKEMIGWALQPGVGIVGARLLYPDGRIQHAGILLGVGGIASHFYWKQPHDQIELFARSHLAQDLSAVTAACMLVKRSVWQELAGFNENNLAVNYNDIDFCSRAKKAGYRVIWTPFATLIHHESVSRAEKLTKLEGRRQVLEEREFIRQHHLDLICNDPAYNPNLSLENLSLGNFAWPPRAWPWGQAGARQ
jgi:GT2 family glycosyltransferase